MKNLLKKIALTLTLLMIISSIQPIVSVNATEREESKIENKEALELFRNLTKNNKATRTLQNTDKNPSLINEFEELNFLSIENENDIKILYNSENQDIASVIAYNYNSNSYIMLEANNKTEDVIIAINDKEYVLKLEGENIFAYSDNGEKLPLLITEYQSEPNGILYPQRSAVETRTSFGKNYGPFYRTNKALVDVLGTVSTLAGPMLSIIHPVLGKICTVAGVVTTIAGNSYATLYIKYYQAYATNDPTYVRQTDYYYNYNNYTSLVKSNVWHFYSSRPY